MFDALKSIGKYVVNNPGKSLATGALALSLSACGGDEDPMTDDTVLDKTNVVGQLTVVSTVYEDNSEILDAFYIVGNPSDGIDSVQIFVNDLHYTLIQDNNYVEGKINDAATDGKEAFKFVSWKNGKKVGEKSNEYASGKYDLDGNK